jgi:CRISPR type III-A-associated RAMP protein Csm4
MNPGLVIKLRPSGPWRIGPDSGARNRVDVIYHSDSLYSAVTSAMSRMGRLEEWLDATARNATPAVCFSSCFPFVEEIGFVVPPRTVWPPASPALMAAHVRWKSARFIPLTMVEAILAGRPLDPKRWSVDGPSGCLIPTGRPGPFRTSVRWGAAVDRLSGASERHSMACIEFRPGAGLWTVIGFSDDAARDQWQDAVKAAFRLLADTGFGGERSRGWGRSETPEFIEGELPEMILAQQGAEKGKAAQAEPVATAPLPISASPPNEPQPDNADAVDPDIANLTDEPKPGTADAVDPDIANLTDPDIANLSTAPEPPADIAPLSLSPVESGEPAPERAPDIANLVDPDIANVSDEPAPDIANPADPDLTKLPVPDGDSLSTSPEPSNPGPQPPLPGVRAHWLLSLFTPAAADTVDWARGSYTVMARGGRVDSPAGSGELKKQLQMVAEGSVLVAKNAPTGAAPDVAPDGFAHPVFRAGFALAIPLPEGN